MKVEQKKEEFTPIKITLESAEEANILQKFIEEYYIDYAPAFSKERQLLIKLSDSLGECGT